jgi:long-chain acyl-CoA synthetase
VDFTEESGYLTPSLKVKRAVVAKDFASDIDALYSQPRPGSQPRRGA